MTLTPDAADRIFDAIVDLVARGERDAAVRASLTALDQGLDEPLVLLLAAEGLEERGETDRALALLHEAVRFAPEEAETWFCLGVMLIRQSRDEEGLEHLKAALERQPDLLPALDNAATVSYRLGQLSDAQRFYQRIAELSPGEVRPVAAGAAIAARQGDTGRARDLAQQAIAMDPDNVTAEMALARADLLEHMHESALSRMQSLMDRSDREEENTIAILDLRAEALDGLDRAGAAFSDYRERNRLLRRKHAPRIDREVAERCVDQARRLYRDFAEQPARTWGDSSGPDTVGAKSAAGHVFLLGFPRSGTTLLEKALASHESVVTLEELDHLGELSRQWLAVEGGLARLARLSAQEAEEPRADYWKHVRESTAGELRGRTLVDKLPLHTVALPVIAKLFPDAKILFALRDPRDVVLSCFRRRFRINPAMFEFLALDGAARYYDSVMSLARLYRRTLPLSLREVRHETLTAAFEPTLSGVLEYLGLEWHPALARFTEALPADPRTPSDMQLRGGLNTQGIGHWQRYGDEMKPVMGILEPWVKEFGYPTN